MHSLVPSLPPSLPPSSPHLTRDAIDPLPLIQAQHGQPKLAPGRSHNGTAVLLNKGVGSSAGGVGLVVLVRKRERTMSEDR